MKPKFIQKNIRFPSTVIEVLEKDGERFGFNFNEYVKYLVVKKVEEIEEEEIVFTPDEIEEIKEAIKLSNEGKLPRLKPGDDVDNFLKKLTEEDG